LGSDRAGKPDFAQPPNHAAWCNWPTGQGARAAAIGYVRPRGRRRRFESFAMTGEHDSGGGQAGARVKDSRQDRLKLALRENLKRRKSQARGREDVASEPAQASLDDASLDDGSREDAARDAGGSEPGS